jgi:hypothetical protein
MAARKGSLGAGLDTGTRPTLRMLHLDPVHCIAMFHDLLLSVSRGEPSLQFLQTAGRLIKEETQKWPDKIAVMIVINADARAPSDEARAHVKKTYPEFSEKLAGMVRVIEGEGFIAAAKRSAVAIIDLAMRLKCPTKVVGTVHEGGMWIMRQMGPADHRRYSALDIVMAVRELRTRHDAAYPPSPPS